MDLGRLLLSVALQSSKSSRRVGNQLECLLSGCHLGGQAGCMDQPAPKMEGRSGISQIQEKDGKDPQSWTMWCGVFGQLPRDASTK